MQGDTRTYCLVLLLDIQAYHTASQVFCRVTLAFPLASQDPTTKRNKTLYFKTVTNNQNATLIRKDAQLRFFQLLDFYVAVM